MAETNISCFGISTDPVWSFLAPTLFFLEGVSSFKNNVVGSWGFRIVCNCKNS